MVVDFSAGLRDKEFKDEVNINDFNILRLSLETMYKVLCHSSLTSVKNSGKYWDTTQAYSQYPGQFTMRTP